MYKLKWIENANKQQQYTHYDLNENDVENGDFFVLYYFSVSTKSIKWHKQHICGEIYQISIAISLAIEYLTQMNIHE